MPRLFCNLLTYIAYTDGQSDRACFWCHSPCLWALSPMLDTFYPDLDYHLLPRTLALSR
jgi:hypothetical protein